MPIREFSGELDATPAVKEFDGILDAAIPTIPAAKRLKDPTILDQFSGLVGKLFGESSVMDGMDGTTNASTTPQSTITAASAAQRVLNQPTPDAMRSAQRQAFAAENPVLGGIASGSARAVQGGLDAVPLVADAVNQYAVNPVAKLFGQELPRASRLPGAETLQQAAQDFAPDITKRSLSGVIANDELGSWLAANMAQQAPQVMQSVGAAVMPAARVPLLLGMGGQAAGGEYQQNKEQGFATQAAIADALTKGNIEILSEMLPLGVFDKVKGLVNTVPLPLRGQVVTDALQRIMASGAALSAQGLTGAIEESVAQIGGNASEQLLLGKGTPLLDKVPESAVLGAAAGGVLGMPNAMTAVQKSPDQEIATAIMDAVNKGSFTQPADQIARERLSPNGPTVREFTGTLDQEPVNESTDALAPNGTPDPGLPDRADPAAALAAPVPVQVAQPQESPNTAASQDPAAVQARGMPPQLPDTVPVPGGSAAVPAPNTQGLASSSPVNPIQTDAIATSSAMPQQATAEDTSPAPSFQAPNAIDTEVARQVEAAAAGMKPGDIARANGAAFKTKPEALKHAKQAGKGWRAVKGGGGYVVRHYAPSANQVANAKARQRDMSVVNPEKDSLFAAIAKLGGIAPDQLTKQWGLKPEEFSGVRGAGIKRVASKNGMKLDRMAEGLAELGYLSYDENGKHDLEEFFELFDGELRGAKHYTPIGFENVAREQQEQEWLAQQDAQALDALPEDGQDNIEGQLDDYETASEQDEADLRTSLDRAYGEVNDDTRAEEGNDGTVDQADPGTTTGASAAERPGNAERGSSTGSPRRIRDEIKQGGPLDADPDADIPFDANDSRLKTDTRSAADTARDRAKQKRMAVQRRYEQDADASERDFQLKKIQKELDAELQAAEGFGDVPFSRGDATQTEAFKRWSKGYPVIAMDESVSFRSGQGVVVEVVHGTTGDFSKFDRAYANIESDLGGGFYFTNNVNDVGANYAGTGPDLTNKIERLAEQIANETDRDYDDPDVRAEAEARFKQHEGASMPVFVRFDNPVVIGGDGETFLDYAESYDEETEEYGEPEGRLVEFFDALRSIDADSFSDFDADQVIGDIMDRAVDYSGLNASELIEAMKASEGLMYAISHDGGDNASSEIIRQAFEGAGFDGFIDLTVNKKFGSEKRIGKSMEGMDEDTVHFIAFKPTQIKSRTGNNGKFDPENADITMSRSKARYAGMTVEQVQTAIAADTFGHDVDVYASMDEAPDYIRMQASREDGGDVEGYWDIVRNRVVLIAENLDSPERAREVARHELIGHYGLENMLQDSADPDAMGKLVQRVLRAEADGNKVIADLAAQVDRTQPGLPDTRRAKEVIAIMAERNIQNSITKRVYDLIRKFFKKIGFLKSDITDAKIADLLRDAQKYLQANKRGTLANPEAAFSRQGEAAVLDTGSTIADQMEAVRRAVKSEMRRLRNESGDFADRVEDSLTGQDLLDRITERLGSESEAQAYLGSLGIHGIKQGSETIDLQEMAFSRGDVAEELVDTNSQGQKISYVRANLDNFWNWYGDGEVDAQGRPVVDGHLYTNDKGQKKSINNIGTYDPKQGSTLYSRKAGGQTESAAFKRWFGDSKVVDAEGKPLVMYHGTDIDFSEFKKETIKSRFQYSIGFHFTTRPTEANRYAERENSHVMPVYLKAENPLIVIAKQPSASMEADLNRSDIIHKLVTAKRAGTPYDSVIIKRDRGDEWDGWNVITFDPAQIKSATGNRGTFDPENADVTFSRKADSAFDVTNPGVLDNLTRAMQDNKIDLKRVQQAITEQGGTITESEDAYLNEELYIGKVSAQFDKLNEKRVTPLIEAINKSGLTPEEVNDFLYARHAPEANARLKKLNPGKRNDALSGMSDEKAAQLIAGFKSSGKYDKLVKIAGIVDTITKETRRRIVANGLETADMIAKWEGAYQHYVPLKADDDIAIGMKNSGFTVRGAESQRRLGQDSAAKNILANVIAQAQSSIKRSEKAKVGRSLLDLARANPNKDFWTVDKPVRKREVNPETGLMEWVVDKNFKEADNVLVVKENGEDHYIVFNTKNERGMRIAAAMKNLDAAQLPWLAEATGKFTRHLAQWITARNPLFWVTNFARDIQGAAFNLQNTPIAGKEAAVMAAIPKAMKGYWKITRGDGQGQWADYAKEFKAAGAETGFIKVFETADDHMADLEAQFKQMKEGKANPKKLARALVTAIDDYNTVIENGVRLAVYQTGRENGLSIRKAASLAKNITVNFNRKGNQSTFFNSLYMFMNASIQGNVRFLTAVATSRRAQVVAGSLVGIGFLLDAVNRSIGGDDEETGKAKYDLIPEFERERNWIFMSPSGKYIKVPMPYGPHIAMNMGRMLSDSIFGEKADPLEKALSMARITVDAFNPLGSNGSFGQLIAPSVVKPIVQISENKAFHGGPAYKEAFGFGYEAPAYTRHFKSTGEHWIDASKLLNDITGGDAIAPGKLDVPPEVLRTLFLSYVAPGLMQTADKTLDTSTRAAKGEKIEPSQVPALSRFYGEAPEERAQERAYYEKQREIKQSIEQVKKYAKDGNREGMNRTLEELGDGDIQAGKRIKAKWEATEKQLTRIQSAKRKLEQDKVEDDRQAAQLDRLDDKRMALIKKMLR